MWEWSIAPIYGDLGDGFTHINVSFILISKILYGYPHNPLLLTKYR